MTQYNSLNIKRAHSQLKKLISKIKNVTEVTLSPHKLSSTDRQASRFCEAFEKISSTNIKSSNTETYKVVQSGRLLAYY